MGIHLMTYPRGMILQSGEHQARINQKWPFFPVTRQPFSSVPFTLSADAGPKVQPELGQASTCYHLLMTESTAYTTFHLAKGIKI